MALALSVLSPLTEAQQLTVIKQADIKPLTDFKWGLISNLAPQVTPSSRREACYSATTETESLRLCCAK